MRSRETGVRSGAAMDRMIVETDVCASTYLLSFPNTRMPAERVRLLAGGRDRNVEPLPFRSGPQSVELVALRTGLDLAAPAGRAAELGGGHPSRLRPRRVGLVSIQISIIGLTLQLTLAVGMPFS